MTKYLIAAILGLGIMTSACSSAQKTEDADAALAQAEQNLENAANQKLTINFDFDSSLITRKSYPLVKMFLQNLKQENIIINVDGYTDDIGSEIYNSKLSMQRAEAAADFLVDNGVNRDIIVTRGHGETDFVADNDTEEGRAKNRRVEISITK